MMVVQGIDAVDNGAVSGDRPVLKGTDEKLRIKSVSEVISLFNPAPGVEEEDFDSAFMMAVEVATKILTRQVMSAWGFIQAEQLVVSGYRSEDRMLVLNKFVPWQEHAATHCPEALYCVFPQSDTGWMVQCVPVSPGSFTSKKLLPSPWAGLRDEQMAEVTGVADSVFCHTGRFICGAKSFEGAMALATLALNA